MAIEDPTISVPLPERAALDEEVATFLKALEADARVFGRRDMLSIEKAREVHAEVRKRWIAGGPRMAATREHTASTRHGPVMVRTYEPQGIRVGGALVYLHGGGYVLGSVDTYDRVLREYAARASMVVIGVEYTRAPEARFPRPTQECTDAIRWIAANGGALGIDGGKLIVGGDSAGGIMALAACIDLRDSGDAPPRGMLLNYSGVSSNLARNSVMQYGDGTYGLSLMGILWYRAQHIATGAEVTDPRNDLLRADLRGLPPSFLVIAECDPVADSMRELAQRMRAAGNAVDAKVYPGAAHSFLEAVSISRLANEAFDDSARWIRRVGG